MPKSILSKLVDQFETKNGHKPKKIVVAPIALATLSIKRSIAPIWEGIPVECRLFEETEVVEKGTVLGIFVYNDAGTLSLRSCDLP